MYKQMNSIYTTLTFNIEQGWLPSTAQLNVTYSFMFSNIVKVQKKHS